MSEESQTVVYCPCPGALEVQLIHAQLRSFATRLGKELTEQYAERDDDGLFVYEDGEDVEVDEWICECGDMGDDEYGWEDCPVHGSDSIELRGALVYQDTPEAKAAIANHELSLQAIQACRDALVPANAPFVKAQEEMVRSEGAIPDWYEVMDNLSDMGERAKTIHFNSDYTMGGDPIVIPPGTYDMAGATWSDFVPEEPKHRVVSPPKPYNHEHPFKKFGGRDKRNGRR